MSMSVLNYLKNGQFYEANASSTHFSGQSAKKEIDKSQTIINGIFKNNDNFNLFFHSGSSEGISTFFNLNKKDVMVYFESDHPAVHAVARLNEQKGVIVLKMPINSSGLFDLELFIETLKQHEDKDIYINFTYVHNETGVIWPLSIAQKIKENLRCFIHVDAAQVVGKILNWQNLNPLIDMYTFSAHKFGGLNGFGFSYRKKDFDLLPLIPGGGQQGGARGGTLNLLGIITTQLALQDVLDNSNYELSNTFRSKIENRFEKIIGEDGFVVLKNEDRAVNTSLLCFKKHKGDFLQINFDMAQIDVSFGSACSAGSLKGSGTMRALGFEDYDKNIIRISFSPYGIEDIEKILSRIEHVFLTLK